MTDTTPITEPIIGGYVAGYRRDGALTATQLQAIDHASREAVVETFSTFCFCKPPHLNADNVCSCGVAWGKP